ncbi:sensor histidine kinase [Paenibacillus sp. CAA11]|uniref:HAMP domain-containing sensor histidine kinase n=1 Tax=Paenibacillus sp. CAA11 TaxID=1532905 RepID=UPI000D37E727|nr:HAMP domain-containing sensor histidine kinase [Paenibacillus sp. CAA11]AWB46369.1 sensor histidine kinase [Paenibacillus sp. CAA11]
MKSTGIYKALVRHYVIFSFILGLVFTLIYLLLYLTSNEIKTNAVEHIQASSLVRPDYRQIDAAEVKAFGGWVEVLDESHRVVFTSGHKQDGPNQYTDPELYELFYDNASATESKGTYRSLAPLRTEDGRSYLLLVQIPGGYFEKSPQLVAANEQQVSRLTSLSLRGLLLFLLIFALNVWLYSRWTAKKITRPLAEISTGIREVAQRKYRKRLHFKSYVEFEQIQQSFNEMAERLEASEAARKELEQSQKRMLLDISHDLKTPITTIQGYAEALQLQLVEDEPMRERYIRMIYDKSRIIARMVSAFFDWAKLDSPGLTLRSQPGDIAEFMRALVAEWYEAFEQKGLRLDVSIPEQKIELPFDRNLLYRAVANLLSNAVQYNSAGTEVSVGLSKEPDRRWVRLWVADQGSGIPEELQATIFEPFVRGDLSRRSDGGTGLGLSIARHIAEEHGGELRLDTGKGWTRFEILLPE